VAVVAADMVPLVVAAVVAQAEVVLVVAGLALQEPMVLLELQTLAALVAVVLVMGD